MFLFPAVGAMIGLLAGAFSMISFLYLPDFLSGLLTVSVILLITGLHHTDGLLDMGDGLMKMGSNEEKIEAMRDRTTGIGGFALTLVVLMATVFAVSNLEVIILEALIAGEIIAKFSMLLCAKIGSSAHEGLNAIFIGTIHGNKGTIQLVSAFIISVIPVFLLFWIPGILVFAISLIPAVFLVWISNRHFGGLTGDVLGAMNDISRLGALVGLLLVV